MALYQPLSSYDYREHTLYTHIAGDFSLGKINGFRFLRHYPEDSVTDLHLSTLSWTDASALLSSIEATRDLCANTAYLDAPPQSISDNRAYQQLFDSLSYFKRHHCPLLLSYIESFYSASIPLQEFRFYLDAWQCFGPSAKSNDSLVLMAFYSAVVVGDIVQAQSLEALTRQIFSSLPVNSLIYIMTSNIFCLYLIRLGRPLTDVLSLNSSIINKVAPDQSEALSILLLNRARLMARLGSPSQALRNLQLSFSLRCELAEPPCGLSLLYLLYYLRWSSSCISYSTIFDLIGLPGLTSLSWRMASLLGLPAQARLIFVNRRLIVPASIVCSNSLFEWATYFMDNI